MEIARMVRLSTQYFEKRKEPLFSIPATIRVTALMFNNCYSEYLIINGSKINDVGKSFH